MAKHIRPDYLSIWGQPKPAHWNRVFNRNSGNSAVIKRHKKRRSFFPLLNSLWVLWDVSCSGDRQISARRVRGQQVPPVDVMQLPVHCGHLPPLDGLERIAQDMPLWMSAGRFLNVAGICLMPQCAERLADFLRFLAGNQNFHTLPAFPRSHSASGIQRSQRHATMSSTVVPESVEINGYSSSAPPAQRATR